MQRILWLVVIGYLLWSLFAPPPKAYWRGQLIIQDPVQNSDDLPPPWVRGKDTFTPRAHYQIKAVVLSTYHYWFGSDEDDLAPYDFALGWGPMSDAAVVNALKVSQRGRWYNYSWTKDPPLDPREIAQHSANNHIIPANKKILKGVASVRRLDSVFLKGYLVSIARADGWHWDSSLSREDTGGGSCELFWVESVEIVKRP
jgi:hypothetical protein